MLNNPFSSLETKDRKRERLRKLASEQDGLVMEVLGQLRQALHPDWVIITGFYKGAEIRDIKYWLLKGYDGSAVQLSQPAILIKFVYEGYGYIENTYFTCQRLNFPHMGDWQEEYATRTSTGLIKALKDLHGCLTF